MCMHVARSIGGGRTFRLINLGGGGGGRGKVKLGGGGSLAIGRIRTGGGGGGGVVHGVPTTGCLFYIQRRFHPALSSSGRGTSLSPARGCGGVL